MIFFSLLIQFLFGTLKLIKVIILKKNNDDNLHRMYFYTLIFFRKNTD